MRVLNVHERLLDAPAEQVGTLLAGLASTDDLLWPHDRWPPMHLDRPLGVGATGGHGPIRYVVEAYAPGRSLQFRFLTPVGFVGVHRFEIEPRTGRQTVLRHVIDMRVSGRAYWAWLFVIRPLHNALLEDALDRAACAVGKSTPLRRWSLWVKWARWLVRHRRPHAA
jgi:hypothetical protein